MELTSTPDDLSSDYGAAVVHLVWDVNRKSKERTLLCGAVELLPLEVPAPLEVAERSCTLSGEHFLYVTDRVLPLAAALDWYEQAKSGSPPRPDRAGALIVQGSDKFSSMAVDEEPEAPTFCLAEQSFPFAAGWHCCSRTRHLIARSFRIDQLWTADELATACSWLETEVHFDFTHNSYLLHFARRAQPVRRRGALTTLHLVGRKHSASRSRRPPSRARLSAHGRSPPSSASPGARGSDWTTVELPNCYPR